MGTSRRDYWWDFNLSWMGAFGKELMKSEEFQDWDNFLTGESFKTSSNCWCWRHKIEVSDQGTKLSYRSLKCWRANWMLKSWSRARVRWCRWLYKCISIKVSKCIVSRWLNKPYVRCPSKSCAKVFDWILCRHMQYEPLGVWSILFRIMHVGIPMIEPCYKRSNCRTIHRLIYSWIYGQEKFYRAPQWAPKYSCHKWIRYLSFCQKVFYYAKRSLVLKGCPLGFSYQGLKCVSVGQNGGESTCKRHSDA